MERTRAQLEAALAYWQNVRWQARTEELRKAAHEQVTYFRNQLELAKLREARAQECCGGGCEEGRAYLDAIEVKHGATCSKEPHLGTGYLHGEDDDATYLVDGSAYCGRCHMAV